MDRKKNSGGFINLLGPVGLLFLFSSLVVGVVVVTNKDFILDLRKRASEGEYATLLTPKPIVKPKTPKPGSIEVVHITSAPKPKPTKTPSGTNTIQIAPEPKTPGPGNVNLIEIPKPVPTSSNIVKTIGDIYEQQISDFLDKLKSE